MSTHATTLIAGAKHSRSNADKMRAWFVTRPDMAKANRVAYVRDYERRKFLTKEDADRLVADL